MQVKNNTGNSNFKKLIFKKLIVFGILYLGLIIYAFSGGDLSSKNQCKYVIHLFNKKGNYYCNSYTESQGCITFIDLELNTEIKLCGEYYITN